MISDEDCVVAAAAAVVGELSWMQGLYLIEVVETIDRWQEADLNPSRSGWCHPTSSRYAETPHGPRWQFHGLGTEYMVGCG
jgi:hypothetical protein